VPDPLDAEDVLQDVFYRLVEANRLLMPIEHVTGWLFRVARNRITDLFRKKEPENFSDLEAADEGGELLQFEDLLPRRMPGRRRSTRAVCCSMNWSGRSTNCRRNSARCLSRMSLKDAVSRSCRPRPEKA